MFDIDSLKIEERFRQKIKYDLNYLLSKNIPDIQKIILFGSCARNIAKNKSDVDLMVVTSDFMVDRLLRGDIYCDLDEPLSGVTTDVVFYNEDDFKNANDTFTNEVKKHGITIWERNE
jgi:uncharacterized protein